MNYCLNINYKLNSLKTVYDDAHWVPHSMVMVAQLAMIFT